MAKTESSAHIVEVTSACAKSVKVCLADKLDPFLCSRVALYADYGVKARPPHFPAVPQLVTDRPSRENSTAGREKNRHRIDGFASPGQWYDKSGLKG